MGLMGVTGRECSWYQARILYPPLDGVGEAPATAKEGEVKNLEADSCMDGMFSVCWERDWEGYVCGKVV